MSEVPRHPWAGGGMGLGEGRREQGMESTIGMVRAKLKSAPKHSGWHKSPGYFLITQEGGRAVRKYFLFFPVL